VYGRHGGGTRSRLGHRLRHIRGREARHHFIGHRHGIDRRGDFDRALAHVFFVYSLVGVEIRVVCGRAIIEGVLAQADSRQPGIVERGAIGAAGLAAEIRRQIDADVKLVEGRGGVFDVVADGKLLFSKRAEGRFPDPQEILRALGA